MKPIKIIYKLLVSIGVMMFFSYASCDKWVCGDNWFVNKTVHKIHVNVYCHGEVNNELSFLITPNDSINRITCGWGGPVDPFTSNTCGSDSILVVFNDTLPLNTFKYLEYNPMNLKVLSKTKFRYEFTEAHYQKALEVNGYSR